MDPTDGGTPAPADNAPAGEGTTPQEVAQVLNLPSPPAEEQPTGPKPVDDDTATDTDTPPAPEPAPTEEPKAELPKPPETETPPAPAEAPSFALEVEDANGNTIAIEPGSNLEDVLKDFEPKNNGQIFQIIKDLNRLEGEKGAWEQQQEESKVEADRQELITNIQAGWEKEITGLQGSKRIATGSDGKVNQERIDAVFKFMAEENNKRQEQGLPLLQSFEDTLDKLELREMKEEKAKQAQAAKDESRKNGALVGGSSAPATTPSPVYQSGSARNMSEAIRQMGLID